MSWVIFSLSLFLGCDFSGEPHQRFSFGPFLHILTRVLARSLSLCASMRVCGLVVDYSSLANVLRPSARR